MQNPRPETPAGFDEHEVCAWTLMKAVQGSLSARTFLGLTPESQGALHRLFMWGLLAIPPGPTMFELTDLGRKWRAADG